MLGGEHLLKVLEPAWREEGKRVMRGGSEQEAEGS
jgi:hypothetical protein